ncbi:MAG: hypothetical protein ABSH01_26180 [Terriglobia bacterium]|jgi:hypothetical protein
MPEEDHVRGSVILVVTGLAASAFGGMTYAAAGIGQPARTLGLWQLVVGGPMFALGLLVEFFSIGTSLRSIAKSNEETLSLLKARPGADPQSKVHDAESPAVPSHAA